MRARYVNEPADPWWASDPWRETQRFEATRAALRDAVSRPPHSTAESWPRRALDWFSRMLSGARDGGRRGAPGDRGGDSHRSPPSALNAA
jgi:hypothetical protein